MNRLSRRGFLTGLGLLALTPQVLRAQTAPGADPAFEGTLAYAVLDPATGEVLAQRAADLALPPASTLKSVTALYALDRLGEALAKVAAIDAGQTIMITVSAVSEHGRLVKALDLCAKNGLKSLSVVSASN